MKRKLIRKHKRIKKSLRDIKRLRGSIGSIRTSKRRKGGEDLSGSDLGAPPRWPAESIYRLALEVSSHVHVMEGLHLLNE